MSLPGGWVGLNPLVESLVWCLCPLKLFTVWSQHDVCLLGWVHFLLTCLIQLVETVLRGGSRGLSRKLEIWRFLGLECVLKAYFKVSCTVICFLRFIYSASNFIRVAKLAVSLFVWSLIVAVGSTWMCFLTYWKVDLFHLVDYFSISLSVGYCTFLESIMCLRTNFWLVTTQNKVGCCKSVRCSFIISSLFFRLHSRWLVDACHIHRLRSLHSTLSRVFNPKLSAAHLLLQFNPWLCIVLLREYFVSVVCMRNWHIHRFRVSEHKVGLLQCYTLLCVCLNAGDWPGSECLLTLNVLLHLLRQLYWLRSWGGRVGVWTVEPVVWSGGCYWCVL